MRLHRLQMIQSGNEQCAVCFAEQKAGDKAIVLECGHAFHKDCIWPWLTAHSTCPVCRHALPVARAPTAAGHGNNLAGMPNFFHMNMPNQPNAAPPASTPGTGGAGAGPQAANQAGPEGVQPAPNHGLDMGAFMQMVQTTAAGGGGGPIGGGMLPPGMTIHTATIPFSMAPSGRTAAPDTAAPAAANSAQQPPGQHDERASAPNRSARPNTGSGTRAATGTGASASRASPAAAARNTGSQQQPDAGAATPNPATDAEAFSSYIQAQVMQGMFPGGLPPGANMTIHATTIPIVHHGAAQSASSATPAGVSSASAAGSNAGSAGPPPGLLANPADFSAFIQSQFMGGGMEMPPAPAARSSGGSSAGPAAGAGRAPGPANAQHPEVPAEPVRREDLASLPVRELKRKLDAFGLSYRGICDKSDLINLLFSAIQNAQRARL